MSKTKPSDNLYDTCAHGRVDAIGPLPWRRVRFDGGGHLQRETVAAQAWELVTNAELSPPVMAPREALIVAACVVAILVMSTALLWMLAVSLQAPTIF